MPRNDRFVAVFLLYYYAPADKKKIIKKKRYIAIVPWFRVFRFFYAPSRFAKTPSERASNVKFKTKK